MTLQQALKVNGKARHPEMMDDWIFYSRIAREGESPYIGGYFEDSEGQTIILSPESIMREDWEPYKEPCEHEPEGAGCAYDSETRKVLWQNFRTVCKHCSKPIRATGWEEV